MGIRARMIGDDAEKRRQARARLRQVLRRRLTSQSARRRRKALVWMSAASALVLGAALVWGVIQVGMPAPKLDDPPPRPWWPVLIRDDALRHMTAAELAFSRQMLRAENEWLDVALEEAAKAERAGAPAAYVAWLRLRAFRYPTGPGGRYGPMPSSIREQLTRLRRLEPDEPFWELLWGAALIRVGEVEAGKACVKHSLAQPEPYSVPALPTPWRWWAEPLPSSELYDLYLLDPACLLLAQEAVEAGQQGRVGQARHKLELLRRLELKLAQTQRRWVAGGSDWGASEPASLGWGAEAGFLYELALRRLLKQDRRAWRDMAHLAMYQRCAVDSISRSPISPMASGWGRVPTGYWRRAALVLGAALLLACGWAVRPWAHLRMRKRNARLTDLVVRGTTGADVCCLAAGVAAAIVAGWVWHRVGYQLATVPFGMCDCWLYGIKCIRMRSDLLYGGILAVAMSPPALAALLTGLEIAGAWRFRRLCRRAGSGVWDRPLVRPPMLPVMMRGAIPRTLLALALAAFLATAAWQQRTTDIRSLDRAIWPGASASIMAEEVSRVMHVREATLAILAARSVEEAIEATPSALLESPSSVLAERSKDPVEKAYWKGLEQADEQRMNRYVLP
ncbi:MAG: hypothetical protein FJX75_23775 [Armatimonadetes bacterium]|nr:hypothetical protein [Armatimonadota bacterium]